MRQAAGDEKPPAACPRSGKETATDMSPPKTRDVIVTEAMLETRNWHRLQAPFYRVEEVAKFFFGMSASWLRLHLTPDSDHPQTWFVKNGAQMEFRRSNPSKADSSRVFWLSDIQPMAESLHAFGKISNIRLSKILVLVQAEADLYKLFDDPPDGPGDDPGADTDAPEDGEGG